MLELKTKAQLAKDAHILASSFELVRYRSVTYIPADFETRETSVVPDPERTIWLPLNRDRIRRLAAAQFDTLFGNDSELSNFDFMVAQNADQIDDAGTTLLIRTSEGLRQLDGEGQLVDPTGKFVPNAVLPMLNTDPVAKEKTFAVVAEWLNSEEEAHSLLHHLATSLAPGWSAVKYVLLLGEGRNGKSLLMKMLQALFGRDNVSNVTRQHIAESSPTVTELNGKLLNLVFDGQAVYLKDSGAEKTIIAGEPYPVRKLYESTPTIVQSNALFVEGLQHEPKSKDKSTALQKRLVRYEFGNVYPLNHKFEREMLSEENLGAFLALLIDHYVGEDEVAEKLAPTHKSLQLQIEHMFSNSLGLQFLKYVEENDPLHHVGLLGVPITELVDRFRSWRLKENDLGTWAEPDVVALFAPLLNNERRSVRIDGVPRKVRVTTSLKPEAAAFIESLEGTDEDAALLAAVVED